MSQSSPIATMQARRPTAVLPALAEMWHDLVRDLFDPYRPELHYMRGPGPAWRAKHLPSREPEPMHGLRQAAI